MIHQLHTTLFLVHYSLTSIENAAFPIKKKENEMGISVKLPKFQYTISTIKVAYSTISQSHSPYKIPNYLHMMTKYHLFECETIHQFFEPRNKRVKPFTLFFISKKEHPPTK